MNSHLFRTIPIAFSWFFVVTEVSGFEVGEIGGGSSSARGAGASDLSIENTERGLDPEHLKNMLKILNSDKWENLKNNSDSLLDNYKEIYQVIEAIDLPRMVDQMNDIDIEEKLNEITSALGRLTNSGTSRHVDKQLTNSGNIGAVNDSIFLSWLRSIQEIQSVHKNNRIAFDALELEILNAISVEIDFMSKALAAQSESILDDSKYRKELLDYRRQGLERNRQVLKGERYMTWAVFGVVHVLLIIAILLALVEFRRAGGATHAPIARVNRDKGDDDNEEPQPDVDRQSRVIESSEIELSLHKMKVRSAQMGVILMTFSLAFYFLYLKFVYPITVLSSQ